ncbi:hypothetical protein HK101_005824, partial [Irineochytrium annulatum]
MSPNGLIILMLAVMAAASADCAVTVVIATTSRPSSSSPAHASPPTTARPVTLNTVTASARLLTTVAAAASVPRPPAMHNTTAAVPHTTVTYPPTSTSAAAIPTGGPSGAFPPASANDSITSNFVQASKLYKTCLQLYGCALTSIIKDYCADPSNTYCVSALAFRGGLLFTMYSSVPNIGYLALGVSASTQGTMQGAKMYIMWADKTSPTGTRLAVRHGVEGGINSFDLSSDEGFAVATPSRALTIFPNPPSVFSFWRPLNVTKDPRDVTISAANGNTWLWARSSHVPQPSTSSAATILKHDVSNSYLMNFYDTNPKTNGTYCSQGDAACVTWTYLNDTANVVTVTTLYKGWVGVAFGSTTMDGAEGFYVGWTNSTGGATVSRRGAANHALPPFQSAISDDQLLDPDAIGVKTLPGVTFSMIVPGPVPEQIMWAAGSTQPSSVDDPSAPFGVHAMTGRFAVAVPANFASTGTNATNAQSVGGGDDPGATATATGLIIGHAALMALAWALVTPVLIGVEFMIARRASASLTSSGISRGSTLAPKVFIVGVCVPTIAALILSTIDEQSRRGLSTHAILGIVVLALWLLQCVGVGSAMPWSKPAGSKANGAWASTLATTAGTLA